MWTEAEVGMALAALREAGAMNVTARTFPWVAFYYEGESWSVRLGDLPAGEGWPARWAAATIEGCNHCRAGLLPWP